MTLFVPQKKGNAFFALQSFALIPSFYFHCNFCLPAMSEISFKSFNYSPISIVPTLYISPALHAAHVLQACEEAKYQASWHKLVLYTYSQRENIPLFLRKKKNKKKREQSSTKYS